MILDENMDVAQTIASQGRLRTLFQSFKQAQSLAVRYPLFSACFKLSLKPFTLLECDRYVSHLQAEAYFASVSTHP